MAFVQDVGIDAISQATLFAHFRHQARFKPAAAECVVQDKGRKEIRIVARDATMSEKRHGLRHIKGHNGDACCCGDIDVLGQGKAGFRQVCKQRIDQFGQFFRRDVACGPDVDAVFGDGAFVRCDQVIAGQGRDAVFGAVDHRGVGVITIEFGRSRFAGDGVGVRGVRADRRDHLRPDAVDRVLVKARVDQAFTQKRHRLGLVFGQETGRDRDAVIADVIAEGGSKRLLCFCKTACVQIARAFFQKADHQVGHAALAFGIERCTAFEPQFERDEGNGWFFDQPRLKTGLGGDFLNVYVGHGNDGQQVSCDAGQRACECAGDQMFHCVTSVSDISQPVTDASRLNTSRAAARMSSSVVA